MEFFKKYKLPLAVLALVALMVAGYRLLPVAENSLPPRAESPATPAAQAKEPEKNLKPGDSNASLPNSRAPRSVAVADPALPPAERELAPLMAAPLSLRDGGQRREFQLSTTEVSIRGRDGVKKIVSIPPADSPQAFAASLENLRAEHGSEPELVLYPAGFPQNEATRRIATRQVVITAPSRAEADALAATHGLVFQKAPTFAPNSFVYEASTSADALAIQSSQENSRITPLLAMRPQKFQVPNDPFFQLQWHLKHQSQQGAVPGTDINVLSLWNYPQTTSANYTRGQGVVIGIADDGMEWNHPDLSPNALPDLQWDWNQGDNDPSPYYIDDSHGTACAGVAAARGNNRIGVSGVAPEANLVGMRLISGPITDLDEAEAMAWLPDQVHIKSNSWGWPQLDMFGTWYPMHKNGELANAALKYAVEHGRGGKGTIFTFAAGNSYEYYDLNDDVYKVSGARVEFSDYQGSPYTITVGAVSSQGIKSDYSQIGSALLISAPSNTSDGTGLGEMTTDNRGLYGYNIGGSMGDFPSSADVTKTFGGTSSACPTVSGVVALMLQKNPNLGWRDVQEILVLSANRSFDPTGWTTNAAGIQFNYNYGAGLVDAAAAVDLAAGWSNLQAQTSSTIPESSSALAANSSVPIKFNVTDSLRVEHVTLALSIPGIKKGDLLVELTSPAGTNSVLCEPHSDQLNEFDDWTLLTVRNWGENSVGNWTLTVTNNGTSAGNITASLTVYGVPTNPPANPLPVVNLEAKRAFATTSGQSRDTSINRVFLGSAINLLAAATDRNGNGTVGTISGVEFFSDNGTGAVSIGNATLSGNSISSFSWLPPAVGNYSLTATATDGGSPAVSATSAPVRIFVEAMPFAAWDFDTGVDDDNAQSPVSIATAIQSVRQYHANFGSNNGTFAKILFDGTRDSSLWSSNNGEIWTGTGTTENFLAGSNPFGSNAALVLRGGKNLSANGKSLVFHLDMTKARRLQISYAAEASLDGFTTHTWEYWDADSLLWRPIEDEDGNSLIAVPLFYSEIVLDQIAGLGFNGRSDARVRLTVSGATAVSGTNLLDNIRFNATVAP